jgi:hypothetical protein
MRTNLASVTLHLIGVNWPTGFGVEEYTPLLTSTIAQRDAAQHRE